MPRKKAPRLDEKVKRPGRTGPPLHNSKTAHRPVSPLEQAVGHWTAGRRDEAVRHVREMLRQNPNDSQGVRYTLAGFLLDLDREAELAELLQRYADDSCAAWAYARALLAFRQKGDTEDARRSLKAARKSNEHVPDYLLGRKCPPARPATFFKFGDADEAADYARDFMANWKDTAGAIAWLREIDGAARKRKAKASPARGPQEIQKKWLRTRLPRHDDVWQVAFRQIPKWIDNDGCPVRPWLLIVVSRTHDLALAHGLAEDALTPACLWDALARAMQHPAAGEPHLPAEIQVQRDERWSSLKGHIEELGVAVTIAKDLDPAAKILDGAIEQVAGEPEPGLLTVPGITPHQAGNFYEAAAVFFQRTPWKVVGRGSAIQIACDQFPKGPWYAVLLGQSGLERGLSLYEDSKIVRRTMAGMGTAEENARETVATTVLFGEEHEIPVADLEASQRHGWKVARPDAYPRILRKERGDSMGPPSVVELDLMTGCLRAVADFVHRRGPEDPTVEEIIVPGASGSLRLVTSWVQ